MSLVGHNEENIHSITERKLTWFYIEKPTSNEITFLAQRFHFHPLDLDDVLSRIQRPKIDEYEDYVFMVLHFPVFDKQNHITRPSEMNIFIGENYVVTINCSGDLKPLAKFFQECETDKKSRERYLGRSSGFLLYHILDRMVNSCFPILDRVTQNIDDIQDAIFSKAVLETERQISLIRRDLISFRRVVHPQIAVIETLEREEYPFFKEDQEIYFGDVADHIRKIWDGLEDCKDVVDGLAVTSHWLVSDRIQEIMRVLTIVMIMTLPTALLTSFYGMNIPLPGGLVPGSLRSFFVLISIIALISLGIFFFLRRRHWI